MGNGPDELEALAPGVAPARRPTAPYIVGASVMGPSHTQLGLPCQDAFAYKVVDRGLVVAVADGLGSAAQSDVGAELAAEEAVAGGADALARARAPDLETIAWSAIAAARTRLERKAAETGVELRDLACTLLVTLALNQHVCVAHIGDGGVVAATADELVLLSGPGESEYVNEVDPLTSANWDELVRSSGLVTGVEAVATFTDGCQRAALRRENSALVAHPGFFSPLFSFARGAEDIASAIGELAAFLRGPKMSEFSEDDKTLVLAILA